MSSRRRSRAHRFPTAPARPPVRPALPRVPISPPTAPRPGRPDTRTHTCSPRRAPRPSPVTTPCAPGYDRDPRTWAAVARPVPASADAPLLPQLWAGRAVGGACSGRGRGLGEAGRLPSGPVAPPSGGAGIARRWGSVLAVPLQPAALSRSAVGRIAPWRWRWAAAVGGTPASAASAPPPHPHPHPRSKVRAGRGSGSGFGPRRGGGRGRSRAGVGASGRRRKGKLRGAASFSRGDPAPHFLLPLLFSLLALHIQDVGVTSERKDARTRTFRGDRAAPASADSPPRV